MVCAAQKQGTELKLEIRVQVVGPKVRPSLVQLSSEMVNSRGVCKLQLQ